MWKKFRSFLHLSCFYVVGCPSCSIGRCLLSFPLTHLFSVEKLLVFLLVWSWPEGGCTLQGFSLLISSLFDRNLATMSITVPAWQQEVERTHVSIKLDFRSWFSEKWLQSGLLCAYLLLIFCHRFSSRCFSLAAVMIWVDGMNSTSYVVLFLSSIDTVSGFFCCSMLFTFWLDGTQRSYQQTHSRIHLKCHKSLVLRPISNVAAFFGYDQR